MKIGDYETHPAADVFPLLDDERHRELVNSIRKSGLRVPITLCDGKVLDGRNRLRACLEAGKSPRFDLFEGGEPEQFVWDLNAERRDITASQRTMARLDLLDQAKARKAEDRRERISSSMEGNRNASKQMVADLPPAVSLPAVTTALAATEQAVARRIAPKARDEVAAAADVSPRTVQNALKVRESAVPEVVQAVRDGRLAVDAAVQVAKLPEEQQRKVVTRAGLDQPGAEVRGGLVRAFVKQEVRAAVAERLAAEPVVAADDGATYRTIVADPPWAYTKREGDASHRGDLPYPPMPTDAVCALGEMVRERAHPDGCVLWLWTTNAFLRDAYRVLDAWGFEERTVLTWVKDRWGLGDWLRGQSEHCIVACRGLKGTPPWWGGEAQAIPSTVLHGPLREHSRKPDEFYALVDSLCPGPKFELFSRTPRPSWVQWGAEPEVFHAA